MADARRRPLTSLKGDTLPLGGTSPVPPPACPHVSPAPFARSAPTSPLDERLEHPFEYPHASPSHEDDPGIELVVVREDAVPKHAREIWRAIEVWTKNHVYGIDSGLICFEVLDRASGRLDPTHAMLGGKLGGGRKRSRKGATFTHPLPLPGTEAMFLRARKQGFTSAVERIIVRMRVLRVRNAATWEQLLERASEE